MAAVATVRLVGLTKDYDTTRALDDINLTVEQGQVFGYLGPNGAGKTTTIRVLLGLLRPTAGRAELFGLDAWRDSVRIHARTGYLPGDAGLYDRLCGRDIVEYFARLRHRPADIGVAEQLAERFDLDLDRRVKALSRGNRQKLALVQAFMSTPDLAILDEPTSGLDPIAQQEFHELLRETTARGGTVMLSSHVLDEVQRMADRVGIIRAGRLIAVERLEELRARALHRVVARVAGPVDPTAIARIPGVSDLAVDGGTIHCGVPEGSLDLLVKALARFTVVDLSITEADLEEMFLSLYGEQTPDAA